MTQTRGRLSGCGPFEVHFFCEVNTAYGDGVYALVHGGIYEPVFRR